MAVTKLIADSGATKAEWCLIDGSRKKILYTQGISPYFLNTEQIHSLLLKELCPFFKKFRIDVVYYYGTGCANPGNARIVKKALQKTFPESEVQVTHDLMAAARSLCGDDKGIPCILGTGSNSCYYNGKKIIKNSPGLGYILGDEGSGAYLGKKVLQYYLYRTFDEDLKYRFTEKFALEAADILDHVCKQPLPNRFLASFTLFLVEYRGRFMIENIID